jgi:hypothetical protein
MELEITCHFCFEKFTIEVDLYDGLNTEIWDCEVCCNPNQIKYGIENEELVLLEVSNGNE